MLKAFELNPGAFVLIRRDLRMKTETRHIIFRRAIKSEGGGAEEREVKTENVFPPSVFENKALRTVPSCLGGGPRAWHCWILCVVCMHEVLGCFVAKKWVLPRESKMVPSLFLKWAAVPKAGKPIGLSASAGTAGGTGGAQE